jgi:hypothetical protein
MTDDEAIYIQQDSKTTSMNAREASTDKTPEFGGDGAMDMDGGIEIGDDVRHGVGSLVDVREMLGAEVGDRVGASVGASVGRGPMLSKSTTQN